MRLFSEALSLPHNGAQSARPTERRAGIGNPQAAEPGRGAEPHVEK